jgi:hypothetical protein
MALVIDAGEAPREGGYREAHRGRLTIRHRAIPTARIGWMLSILVAVGGLYALSSMLIHHPHFSVKVWIGLMILPLAVVAFVTKSLNRTVIRVERGTLSVRYGPFPPRRRLELATSSIERLAFWTNRETVRSATVELHMVDAFLHDGSAVTLISGIRVREEARRIRAALEEHLGLGTPQPG